MFGSRGDADLVMKPGDVFVCTHWDDTATGLLHWGPSPLVEYDAAADMLYATGSHDPIGPRSVDTQVSLAETAPNYFEQGVACPPPLALPVVGITSILDASVSDILPGYSPLWIPKATVTVKDQAGTLVAGATVDGSFLAAGIRDTCVTVADGTCTIGGGVAIGDSTANDEFTINSVTEEGMAWDGQHVSVTVYDPNLTTPTTSTPAPTTTTSTPAPPTTTSTPAPMSNHIGDLDNAATASSWWSWQPKVTATVLDSTGAAVAGATVSGTFSNHSGTLTCVTAANGKCTVGNFSFNMFTKSTVFKVTGVVKASSTYKASANSDPDGDSKGTTITVKRP